MLFATQTGFAQCPNCRAAVQSGLNSGATNVGKGLNQGILYLLALPYLIVGIIGFMWYKSKKAQSNS
jgi:hypothetical protein